MKWKEACMESVFRKARREDAEGTHTITVSGDYDINNRETDEVYGVPTSRANRYHDWEPIE
jgi:hypothetical protein